MLLAKIAPGKTCSACGVEQPLTEFHRSRATKSGYVSACKPCARGRYQRWATAHPDKVKARQVAWTQQSAAHPDKKIRDKTSYQRRREAVLAQKRLYAASLSEPRKAILAQRSLVYQKAYRDRNPGLTPSCQSCNSSKGSLLLVQWRASCRPGVPPRLRVLLK